MWAKKSLADQPAKFACRIWSTRLQRKRLPMLRLFAVAACIILTSVSPHAFTIADESFDPYRLEKQVVISACNDPMQLEVLDKDRVLFIERAGDVKLGGIGSEVVTIGRVPVAVFGEVGLLGLACDPAFDSNGWVYLFFCPEDAPRTMRLSRFTIEDERLLNSSEAQLLSYEIDVEGAIHMGGGLCFDSAGNLIIGTGDNCPPIAELPIDFRSGKSGFDALRTSGNTNDLRGKILRIHPEANGTYTIPKGNLFNSSEVGRREIFAMGCRNPFRVNVDPTTGAVTWGDVGPNIQEDLNIGVNGFDEFNHTRVAGNFGWPMFVGDNEAYRRFDFETRIAGEKFDVENPINDSPNNDGSRILPKPMPAKLWYPSTASTRFPSFGIGGRSAMSGPVYQLPPNDMPASSRTGDDSKERLNLPEYFSGKWFIYEWTRNWIQTVSLDKDGDVQSVEPFMPDSLFRKPIDLEFASEGTLYVIEYGDTWGNNTDSQISRVVYRRGNRAPKAVIRAESTAGHLPFLTRLSAKESSDPDGDMLTYRWSLNGDELTSQIAVTEVQIDTPGIHTATVTVVDADGAMSTESIELRVGNSRPEVTIQHPQHGSFLDWSETLHYLVDVNDVEDEAAEADEIPSNRIVTSYRMVNRRSGAGSQNTDPGLTAMRKTTCFSCHTTNSLSAGPAYLTVAERYSGQPDALEKLASKVVTGGAGVWGSKPMPPHPQHTVAEARTMIRWILSLADAGVSPLQTGKHGFLRVETKAEALVQGLEITSEYTDNGISGLPDALRLRGEDKCFLHARNKLAAFADAMHEVSVVDVFEGGVGMTANLHPGSWFAYQDMRLEETNRIRIMLAANGQNPGDLVVRINSPVGKEIGRLNLPDDAEAKPMHFESYNIDLLPQDGLYDLFFIHEEADRDVAKNVFVSEITFEESEVALQRRRSRTDAIHKIVLIPTKLDHLWATHMYRNVCQLMAATLNQTPWVEAIVSPEFDWPADPEILEDCDAIVYYSRPAGDIIFAPQHRDEALRLFERGVGFTAIHWATGADSRVGSEYQRVLGGWFNFDFSGLAVDQKRLTQADPTHPICNGWEEYELRDEFYVNLKFAPEAKPLLQVNIDDQAQVVAWTFHREDGGRSFGVTLGHFHENYSLPPFRRMLANGILWTAGVEIPETGSPVDIESKLLELEDPSTFKDADWTYDTLFPEVTKVLANTSQFSFANGEASFRQSSCSSCHTIGTKTVGTPSTSLGPDLTAVRQRLAMSPNPRAALLREFVDPSHHIAERYKTQVILLLNGQVKSGIVVSETVDSISIISNPDRPQEIVEIDLADIDQRRVSPLSMMPVGLLNQLSATEVTELLAYVESGGDPNYVLYQPQAASLETWANKSLPVQQGLAFWLDAGNLNTARDKIGLPLLQDQQLLAVWPDVSGNGRHASQRHLASQPILRHLDKKTYVEFDGLNDFLSAQTNELKTRAFTAMMIVRPDHNQNWPGLLSANAFAKNDYQTGFNIDLMPEPKDHFESIMTEGPGYAGVTNIMNERHEFGQFFIVTVRSQPGPEGVVLRINGRQQRTLQRPVGVVSLDELTVAARYWSNDGTTPPHVRGFLRGAVAEVLLYDRPLSDDELTANEVFLWQTHRPLLDPEIAQPLTAGNSSSP